MQILSTINYAYICVPVRQNRSHNPDDILAIYSHIALREAWQPSAWLTAESSHWPTLILLKMYTSFCVYSFYLSKVWSKVYFLSTSKLPRTFF